MIEHGEAADAEARAASRTGLGVAGMLRRIGLWAREDAAHGQIAIAGKELFRWKRAADRSAPCRPPCKRNARLISYTSDISLSSCAASAHFCNDVSIRWPVLCP